MSVVPADKRAGTDDVGKIFAGNAQLAVARCSRGQYHNVVHPTKFVKRHIATDLNIAEEANAIPREGTVQNASRSLGALMVRRNPVANQAERNRQLFEHVDTRVRQQLEQMLGEIASGGPGADDANTLFAIRHSLFAGV